MTLLCSTLLNAILALVLVGLSYRATEAPLASTVTNMAATPSRSLVAVNAARSHQFTPSVMMSPRPSAPFTRDVSPQVFRLSRSGPVVRAAKVTQIIKLALDAGKANPAPPVGPALGAAGVNIMQFCKEYNAATSTKAGQVIPVEITVFSDRSFTFVLKTPPASKLLLKAAGLEKGSGTPDKETLATITQDQLKEIAEIKMPDLNAKDIGGAMRIVAGTAKNMGIAIEPAAEAA